MHKSQVIADKEYREGRTLLPVLLEYQNANPLNYLSEDDLKKIALELGLTRSRVYSTASFYSEISLIPRGRHLVRLCGNAPCENAGRKELEQAICRELGIETDDTTDDGCFTLERVHCLGACYMSPAMRVDDQIYGNLTPEVAVDILNSVKKEDSRG